MTTQLTISESAVAAALIPVTGMSTDLQTAIQACVQDVLSALNKGSAAGLPIGVLAGGISLVDYLVKDTLRVVVEQTYPNGQPIDATAEALAAVEKVAEAQLQAAKDAQAAHAQSLQPPPQQQTNG